MDPAVARVRLVVCRVTDDALYESVHVLVLYCLCLYDIVEMHPGGTAASVRPPLGCPSGVCAAGCLFPLCIGLPRSSPNLGSASCPEGYD